jgi:hypothetical protein
MLNSKLTFTAITLWSYFEMIPVRLRRLIFHFLLPFQFPEKIGLRTACVWLLELCCYLFDLIGLPEVLQIGHEWVKWNSRPLNDEERRIAREVFGESLHLHRIRIDEHARIGTRRRRLSYVSFYIINTWAPMRPEILVHELVHVLQYQMLGAVYIPRALLAQRTRRGYNYGGSQLLGRVVKRGRHAGMFNLEQQADIVQDFYRLKNGLPAKWGSAKPADLPWYEKFVSDLTTVRPGFKILSL